jgi:beta-glucosidase
MTHSAGRATRRARVTAFGLTAAVIATGAASLVAADPAAAGGHHPGRHHAGRHHVVQPALTSRSAAIITVHGLKFRDLDRNGRLTPYEDWRLSPSRRAADLLRRMTPAQKAGLLVQTLGLPTTATGYDLPAVKVLVADKSMTTLITRLAAAPAVLADQNNRIQAIAEAQPLGVPAVISTDPRNGFSVTGGQTVAGVGTTAMPDAIGMGAGYDPRLTRKLADIVRQEYRALGIQEGLSPQADLATEPRWTRINGTFGSDPRSVRAQVKAYVEGMQRGDHGLTPTSVATVTKHWVGYGAQENGFDSHYYYGRYATFPGNNFPAHLVPFEGAFAANTSGIMPTYSILKNLVYQGHRVEQTGAGFSSYLLRDLLRGQYGFDGVVLSDWAIVNDCPQACMDNRPPNFFVGPWGAGMPWGVEGLTKTQRFALTLNAGVDQIGGTDEPSFVLEALSQGLVTQRRIDQAAKRVLVQKFELGVFESPYVDPGRAARIAGNARFRKIGDAAQARSLTLLKNSRHLLPVRHRTARTVYLYGVAAEAAQERGLTVVADPGDADLAIVRLSDPLSGPDLNGLNFTGSEADYQAFRAAVASGTRTVAVPKLNRPLILTDVVRLADAVLANYGVSDEVLLETIYGKRSPGGRLPFELPSSMRAVEAQYEDVPDDSARPLFPRAFGLLYHR